MSVYDDPHKGPLKTRETSDQDLRDITGIDQTEEDAIEQSAAARQIRDQEINAAKGGLTTAPSDDGSGAGGNNTRQSLSDDEDNGGFFRAENVKELAKKEGKSFIRSKLHFGKRAKISLLVSALLGGGGLAIVILALIAGGFQFIHAGRSLDQFHMSVMSDQTGIIALKLARNMYQVNNDERQKTRLGVLGNYWADSTTNKMRAAGYSFNYESGAFKSYTVDPNKFTKAQYPGLASSSPEDVQKYFQQRYGMATTINADGTLNLKTTGSAFKEGRLLRSAMRSSGMGPVSYLNSHIIKSKQGYSYNPMRQWITDKDNKFFEKFDEAKKKKEFEKRQRAYTRAGVTPASLTVRTGTDSEGRPVNQEAGDDTQRLIDDGQAAQAAAEAGDPSKLNEFRSGMAGKLTVGGLAAIGVLCLAQGLAAQWDVLQAQNVIAPMERMAAQTLSWGSANEDGGADNVDAEMNGFMADLLFDEKTGTSFEEACSWQANAGRTQSKDCVDLPDDARIDADGGFLTRLLSRIPGLEQACSTAGQVILIGVSVIALGPLTTAFGTAFGLAAGPAIFAFSGWLMNFFLGNQVDAIAEGAVRGAYMDAGAYMMANDQSMTLGGLPMSDEVSNETRSQARAENMEEFRSQTLAYRLFDTNDPRSFFSQVIDKQAPDPVDNLARTATGILGTVGRFGDIFMRPLVATVGAETTESSNYDYGRPMTGMLPEFFTSNDPSMENLYTNANEVADILDVRSQQDGADNYVTRAKKCFGRDIVKTDATDNNGVSYQQWSLAPPTPGDVPLYKDVTDPDNKCYEGEDRDTGKVDVTNPWSKTRMFIFASTTMESMSCNFGGPKDEQSQKSCETIGNGANSGQ